MYNRPSGAGQPDQPEALLSARLQRAASSFHYPPTPQLAGKERLRVQQAAASKSGKRRGLPGPSMRLRMALVAGLVIAALAGLLAVSPVRARVVEWLRVGAVRLILNATPEAPLPSSALSDLAGETSLANASRQIPFQLRLPGYPPDLGAPQQVYVQQINGVSLAIMVWRWPDRPQETRLALYQIDEGDVIQKQLLENIQETSVNDAWALWTTGPYLLTTTDGQVAERRLVQGHALIWMVGRLTYRLETDLPMEEAVKIAESLKDWDAP